MPHTREQTFVAKLRSFQREFGDDPGMFFAMACLTREAAGRLHRTEFGSRLTRFDASEELSFQDLAGLCHFTGGGLASWISIGAFPEPTKTGRFRSWSAVSLARWAASGCRSRNGRPNPKLAAAIGLDSPEPERELSNVERFARGINLPGQLRVPHSQADKFVMDMSRLKTLKKGR